MNEIHELPPIPNADAVIERFGGIRPMATKLSMPVTTVQGWKKRNVIPGNRRDDILAAANRFNIPVLDLLSVHMNPGTAPSAATNAVTGKNPAAPVRAQNYINPGNADNAKRAANPAPHNQARPPQGSATANRIAIAVCIVLIALIGIGLTMIGPKVKRLNETEDRLAQLEQQVGNAQQQEQAIKETLPTDVAGQIQQLQQQAQSVQASIQTLGNDLKAISQGAMPERLAKMEELVGKYMQVSGNTALTGFWARIQGVQAAPGGASGIQQVMKSIESGLPQMMGSATIVADDGTPIPAAGAPQISVDEALVTMRAQDPAMAETFAGVPDQDLKAAVMLLGFSSLRENLRRDNGSFDTDLALLQKVVGNDDPALQEALTKLSPKAQAGVLTPQGLGSEFRKVGGEIVVASLTGKDVSIEDKAKAALHDVLKVEKDGQPLTGTPSQMAVSQAQAQLDAGDVDGAIATLQQLQGPAAEKAAPFIADAQMTQLAGQAQQMLTGNILTRLGGGNLGNLQAMLPGMVGGAGAVGIPSNMAGVQQMLQGAGGTITTMGKGAGDVVVQTIGGGTVVEDKASGTRIYQSGTAALKNMLPGQASPLGLQTGTVPVQPAQPQEAVPEVAPAAQAPQN